MSTRIVEINRYPVKGFSADPLESVYLTAGENLPYDRAWAVENGPSPFVQEAPKHLPKIHFLMLMRNERLAFLDTRFDEARKELAIYDQRGNLLAAGDLTTQDGRTSLEGFLADYCKDELRGPPKVVNAPEHAFTDVADKCVSIINRATAEEIGTRLGARIDVRRFRGNIVIEGSAPWAEFEWVGRRIRVGGATLEPFKRTERCAATNVNPDTAERNLTLPRDLLTTFGHADCGIYARVVSSGDVSVGDEISEEVAV